MKYGLSRPPEDPPKYNWRLVAISFVVGFLAARYIAWVL